MEPSPEGWIDLLREVVALHAHEPRCTAGVVQCADSRHASAPLTAIFRPRLHLPVLPGDDLSESPKPAEMWWLASVARQRLPAGPGSYLYAMPALAGPASGITSVSSRSGAFRSAGPR